MTTNVRAQWAKRIQAWLFGDSSAASRAKRRRAALQATVHAPEGLEARELLSSFRWVGTGDTANHWSNAANWQVQTAPGVWGAATTAPGSVDSVTLDSTAAVGERFINLDLSTTAVSSLGTSQAYTLKRQGAGQLAGSLAVNGAGNLTLDVSSGALTLTGVVSGTGSLFKQGAGTAVLKGANTYSGTTTVAHGVLQVDSAAGLGASTSAASTRVFGGAVLAYNAAVSTTFANETLILYNGATLRGGSTTGATATVGGPMTAQGSLTIQNASGGFTIASHATSTLAGPGTLTLDANGTLLVQRRIAGSGAVVKTGVGTAALYSGNTYTGVTTVSAGVLEVRASDSLGSTSAGTYVAAGAALRYNIAAGGVYRASPEALTFADGASLNVRSTAAGQLFIRGAVVAEGALTVTSELGTAGFGDPYVGVQPQFEVCGPLTLGGPGDYIVYDAFVGAGSIAKSGTGTAYWYGANTYTGETLVAGGRLSVQSASGLGSIVGGTRILAGATLEYAAPYSYDAEALTFADGGALSLVAWPGETGSLTGEIVAEGALSIYTTTYGSGGTFALSDSSGSAPPRLQIGGALTLDGTGTLLVQREIAGAGAIVKNGSGTAVLARNNSYAGTTLVSAGTLQVEAVAGLGAVGLSAGTTVAGGATLQYNAAASTTFAAETLLFRNNGILRTDAPTGSTVTLAGKITGEGSLSIIDASGDLTLDGSGDLAFGASGNLTLDAAGTLRVPRRLVGGGLVKTGTGTLVLSGNNGYSGATTVSAGTLQVEGLFALRGSGVNVAGGATLSYSALSRDAASMTPLTLQNGAVVRAYAQGPYKAYIGGETTSLGDATIYAESTGVVLDWSSIGPPYRFETRGVLTFDGPGSVEVKKQIYGAGSVVMAGTGVLTLSAFGPSSVGAWAGGTTIASGTVLAVNTTGSATGTGDVVVLAGATLGGTGFIAGDVASAGTIDAGSAPGGTGRLDLASAAGSVLTLGGTARFDLAGSNAGAATNGYDQLQTQALALDGATLDVVDHLAPGTYPGDVFVLIDVVGSAATTGAFAGLPEGATVDVGGFTYLVTYQYDLEGDGFANDVALVAASGVSGFVWNDADADGRQDEGEAGLAGAVVELYDAANLKVGEATTDAIGQYTLVGPFAAGSYYAKVLFPSVGAPWTASPLDVGDDAFDSDFDPTSAESGLFSLSRGRVDLRLDAGAFPDAGSFAAAGGEGYESQVDQLALLWSA